jgi:hypothetical protein
LAVGPDRFCANFKKLKDGGFQKTKKTTSKKTTTNRKMPTMNKKQNPWYIAKPLVQEDYVNGKITDDMDINTVHSTREKFKAVELGKFKEKLGKLIQSIKKQKANVKKPNFWYIAKPIVHGDYIKGNIMDDMDLDSVHKMRDEFLAVDLG